MKRERIWLADLVRATDAFSARDVSRMAATAGFVRAALPARQLPEAIPAPPDAAPRPAPSSPTPFEPVRFWRAERAWFANPLQQDGTEAPPPPPSGPLVEPPAGSLLATPRTPEAVPWSVLGPRIRKLLQVESRGRGVDVSRLVRWIAKGRVLERLPRVRRLRWPESVDLWLDRSHRNVPLFDDQEQVVQRLQRLVGRQRVRVTVVEGPPQLATASRVLVLGDVGAWGERPVQAVWARAARAFHQRGLPALAVVPPGKQPPPGWRVALWERPAMADPRRSAHTALLPLIAMAGLLEPGLLRAIRLEFRELGADLGAEFDLLRDPAVSRFDATAILLHPAKREELLARYAVLSDARKQRLAALLSRWHAGVPGEIGVVESITQARGGWRPEQAEDQARWVGARTFVQRLSEQLHPSARTSVLAEKWRRWARRITDSLPDEVRREGELGRALATLREHARSEPASGGDNKPRQLAIVQVGSPASGEGPPPLAVKAEVRATSGSFLGTLTAEDAVLAAPEVSEALLDPLELVPEVPAELDAEVSGWELRTPHQKLVLRPWQRPQASWAAEAGRDRMGLWMALEVRGVRHRMRWIPPGRYLRGSPDDEEGRSDREGPQHSVVISRGFWLGETPVTQALWSAVMDDNPSHFADPQRPVEQVSWDQAKAFCEALSTECPGLSPRLPSEAEWEYACRAGTQTATWLGDLEILGEGNAPLLDSIAWYGGNAGVNYDLDVYDDSSDWAEKQHPHTRAGTRKVATREANPWGLYDMLGNVLEWCEDALAQLESYSQQPLVDPVSHAGPVRVIRGGSWSYRARDVRAADRNAGDPVDRVRYLGFRLAGGPALQGGAPAAGDRPPPERSPRGRQPAPAQAGAVPHEPEGEA